MWDGSEKIRVEDQHHLRHTWQALRFHQSTLHHPTPMNDASLRLALKQTVFADHIHCPETILVEELALRAGETRVDVAVVNGLLHGYEIKSERDNLSRLPQQVVSYGLVLDRATLVVAARHLDGALEIIPEWWGVEVAFYDEKGFLIFNPVRGAQDNPKIDPTFVVELLWREEALQFLEERDKARGYRSKSRSVLQRRIVEVANLDEIRAYVRHCLKNRKDWKAVSSLKTSVD